MNTFRTLCIGMLTCLLLACGGYDDDGGMKGEAGSGSGTAEALESTEFFLAITLPGGETASASQRAQQRAQASSRITPRETVVSGLALGDFSAEVLVPDINEEDGFREVTVDVIRFVDLGDGLYSVEIDGTPQVDTIIYVLAGDVRLKVLALTPGSRATPVRVNLQTTVAVELFLEQVVDEGLNLDDLQTEDVENALEDIVTYLDTVEIPPDLTEEEVLDLLKDEADDACSIDIGGQATGGCNFTYRIGGTVSGLQGSVVLALQNGELLTLADNLTYSFDSVFPEASEFEVTVQTQPLHQTCTLTNATGTIAAGDITNVDLNCVENPRYRIQGMATGIAGNTQISLNAQETLTVSTSGAFAFETTLFEGAAFSLALVSTSPGFTCTLTPSSDVIGPTDFTTVALDCAPLPTFTVGGSVTGVSGTLTLTLAGGVGPEPLAISAAGAFVFTSNLLDATAFNVSVTGQPANQTCSITQGTSSGVIAAANINDLVVTCTDITYAIGGSVAGLSGTVSLSLNGTETLPVSAVGAFAFATRLTNSAGYSVSIAAQPALQTCTVDVASAGTVAGADVNSIVVTCTDSAFTVGGTFTGLQGTARLLLNGEETLAVAADGTFTFLTPVSSGVGYQVSIIEQPANQQCTLTNTQGTMGTTHVTDIVGTCITQNLSVGGTAIGLEGDLLLQLQSNTTFQVLETLILDASGAYQFDTLLGTGETYSVSITYQPPGLTCVISNTTGTMATVNVGNVNLTCNTSQISPSFVVESAQLVLPNEEVRLTGVALDDALFSVDGNNVALNRQTYGYVNFVAPTLAAGTHVVRATSSAGSYNVGLQWAEPMTAVESIAPGQSHNCALQADGSVLCWGDNSFGQLGNGDANFNDQLVPQRVLGLTDAAAMESGAFFSCARRQTGSIVCWGNNQNGELGNGSAELASATPLTVSGIANAAQLSVGYDHACALMSDQTVQCWGNNDNGQLGNGSTVDAGTPVVVTGLTGVTAVKAGALTSCAILADSSVRCWGANGNGQLGNGTTTDSSLPVAVTGLSNVTALATGTAHVCALQTGGTVSCWGSNAGRQFGNVSFVDAFSSVPVAATAVSGVQSLTAGYQHTCAVLSTAQVACWGLSYNAEMGRGYYIDTADPLPEVIPGVTTAIQVAASGSATCAVLADNTARCWGSNQGALLGRGTLNPTETRDYVYRDTITHPMVAPGAFDAGYDSVCAVTAAQGVSCIGVNDMGQLGMGTGDLRSTSPAAASGIGDAVKVSVGQKHACALMQSGQVQCWGNGFNGQLGNGDVSTSVVPVTVTGISTAVDVAASGEHACAVVQGGGVQCWGDNLQGQLGNGAGAAEPVFSDVPMAVAAINDASAVAVTTGASCVLHATGAVSCWGNNDFGQLGNGSLQDSSLPLPVPGVDSAVAITLARYHGCALRSNGSVQCWGGANSNTLLGDGSLGGSARRAVFVKGLPAPAVSVSAGASHTCAVLNTGAVHCWGDNTNEQLGDHANLYGWPPVQVRGISTATAVSVGDDYSCARLQDSSMRCWGLNYAQMGPGVAARSADIRFVPEDHIVTVNLIGATDFVDVNLNGIETINVFVGETAFTSSLLVGQSYTVSVVTEPADQTCVVDSPTGLIASTDITVNVTCYPDGNFVTVTASGLTGFGLVVNLAATNINENMGFSIDGDYTFSVPVVIGDNYLLTFTQQPLGQECTFTTGQGNSTGGTSTLGTPIAAALTCVDLPFTVSGTINGLQAGTVNLLFSGVELYTQNTNTGFTFDTALTDGVEYGIGLVGQPSGQYCSVVNGSGFISNQNVTDVDVQCVAQPFHLSGTISNLAGVLVLENVQSGSRSESERLLRIAGDTSFAFARGFATTDSYYVSIVQQPDGQFCSVDTGFAGTFATADITNVAISCVASTDLPQVNSISPTTVLVGERVRIRGNDLAAASVTVNGQAVTPLSQSQSHIDFASPTLAPGSYPVVVSNANGQANTSLAYGEEINNVASIDGGSEFTCMRMQDGAVRCFGYNGNGQLGLGSINLPGGVAEVPLAITGLVGTTAISLGGTHACAIGSANLVQCWGSNTYGELGVADNVSRDLPTLVLGLSATQMSASSYHTCAVQVSTGNVFCWGANFYGQLGDGSVVDRNAPVQVPNLSGVVMVAAGDTHSCALLASPGGVRCWGYNADGRLGDGTANSSSVPVDVSGITNAVAVVAATSHSCALLATGEVVCWGDNTQRQLGNASLADAFSNIPVSVGNTAQAGVSTLAASGSHSCAISGGGVMCWGDNNNGQLGDGTGLSNSQPVNVADVDNVVSIGLGYSHGCAVRSDGTARCWGRGFNGELGNGQSETAENYVYPKPITHAFDALGTITHFTTGLKHACAVIGAAVYCAGDNARGQLGDGTQQARTTPVQVSGLTDALQVYTGFEHSCALRSNSTVVCWGANDFGQLGNGLTGDAALPTAVDGLSGIVSLSAGYRHTCAATGSGNVYCWGDNDRGSLGVGVFNGIRNVPMQVRDLATAIQVDASGAEGSSCAVLSTGLVACWGANSHGELGHGSLVDSALPIVIPSLSNIAKVSTGGLNRMNDFDDINPAGTHCAIDSAGAVYCWGASSSGQMGLGSGMSNNAVPVRLPLSRPALSVDVGGAHGCAVLNNNTVECWGANNLGQLGIGVDSNDYSRPIAVLGLTTATRLTADRAYTCALLTGGDMQCWGENGWAQMGGGLTDITRRVRYQP